MIGRPKTSANFMHNWIFLFLFIGFSTMGLAAQPTDVSINGLTGKVKRFDERRSSIVEKNGAQKEEKSGLEKSLFFDEAGRLTLQSFSGLSTSETRYLYAKDGVRKAITDRTEAFEKPGKVKIPGYSVSVFTFNAKDNSILEETYRGKLQAGPVLETADRSHRYKFYFDSIDRLIKEEFLSPEGSELTTEEYFYSGASVAPTDVVVSSGGRALQFIKCTYDLDSVGNWTKRIEVRKPSDPRNPVITEVTYRKISYYKS